MAGRDGSNFDIIFRPASTDAATAVPDRVVNIALLNTCWCAVTVYCVLCLCCVCVLCTVSVLCLCAVSVVNIALVDVSC